MPTFNWNVKKKKKNMQALSIPVDMKKGMRNLPLRTRALKFCRVLPSKGRAPQTSTYRTTPKLYREKRVRHKLWANEKKKKKSQYLTKWLMNLKLIINVIILYQPWKHLFWWKQVFITHSEKSQTSNGFFGADTNVSEENKNSTDLFVGYHLWSLQQKSLIMLC